LLHIKLITSVLYGILWLQLGDLATVCIVTPH
jgi:hypothetical protein